KAVTVPIRVIEHQLDIRPFGDDVVKPSLVFVVGDNAVIQLLRLGIGDAVEIDAVKVLEGGQLVTVKAGGANVFEVVLSGSPPPEVGAVGEPRGWAINRRGMTVATKSGYFLQLHNRSINLRRQPPRRPPNI